MKNLTFQIPGAMKLTKEQMKNVGGAKQEAMNWICFCGDGSGPFFVDQDLSEVGGDPIAEINDLRYNYMESICGVDADFDCHAPL